MVWHGMTWYYGMAWYCILYGTIWYGLVKCSVVWYCVVWEYCTQFHALWFFCDVATDLAYIFHDTTSGMMYVQVKDPLKHK